MPARSRAFTLIELLIVVAIIAILAAIAVPNFLEAQVRSKVSRNKADMRTVATGLEAYASDYNRYPPPWEAGTGTGRIWGTFVEPPGGPFHSRVGTVLTTPIAYLTSLPQDPFRSADVNPIAANIQFAAKRHIYYNYPYIFYSGTFAPPSINTFTVSNKLAGAWLLYSVGPDRDEWNRPGGSGPFVAVRVYRDYDPTNGTNSLGNIFRTAASGERLGMDPYFWSTP